MRHAATGDEKGALAEYQSKRDFRVTNEPEGRLRETNEHRFVIQKHAASTLHYDFRLECAGVLMSWAVPKGPSTDPSQRRLALRTEDHPIDYLDFEGVIPEGQYGAGAVIVWDIGLYRNMTRDNDGAEIPLERALEQGHAKVSLEGRKLRGGYALTRMGTGTQWLLVKMRDEHADSRRNLTRMERTSALSGRTVEEVMKAGVTVAHD
jgi:DNA ligase D-like protein (predicted 3'-phosphoesterase)